MPALSAVLTDAAARQPQSVFLRTAEGELTYRQADERAGRLAAGVRALGVGPGTTVALLMDNGLDQVLLWFALNRLGAVHVPLNTALVGDRLDHALRVCEATLLVSDDRYVPAVATVRDRLPQVRRVVVRGTGSLEDAVSFSGLSACPDTLPVSEVADLAPATMLFTSGTTGPSKACVLSHRYLVRQGQLHAEHLGLRSEDVLYCPFPLFHVDAATLTVSAALSVGATAALGARFSVSRFWEEVRAFDATVFNFMGATLSLLWKRAPDPRDRDHRVRLAWGVPMPQWQRGFEDRFGFPLRQVYGSTDAGISVYDPVDGPQKPGAAGRVVAQYDVQIRSSSGRPVPPGTVGEITVRGREPGLVMNGYHGMPEATAEAIVDGWVRTGDAGSLDEDGYLTFHGRLTDSIRRRGENISAFEVEQLVAAHPKVLEAAAVGVPSDLTEEDVKVVVVLKEGEACTAAELHRHCTEVAPRHMVPRYLEIVPRLPKTPTEKVEKFRLTEDPFTPGTWDSERHGDSPRRTT